MKYYLSLLLLSWSIVLLGQPTFLGTQIVDGGYTSYNLVSLGAFAQVRMQATSSATTGTRNWEFATGNYFENWRPYTGGTTVQTNVTIDPAVTDASARYNSGFGGSSSLLPAITTGYYYTFNVTEYATPADQFMSLLETTYDPVTIDMVAASPSGAPMENQAVDVTVTTSSAPAAGEYVYVRYTTDNFATTNLVQLVFTASTGVAQIPGQLEGTTVQYYIYSSNNSLVDVTNSVATNGEVAHDMLTLNLANDGGVPYNYTVIAATAPVEMTFFRANTAAKGIEVSWETSSELNNNYFQLERSAKGQDWSIIHKMEGHLTSAEINEYGYFDKSPLIGSNYYRLRQVDLDGKFTFSSIVTAEWRGEVSTSVVPNPAKNEITIELTLPQAAEMSFQIYNAFGDLVLASETMLFDGGINSNNIDISGLTSGIYYVRIFSQHVDVYEKLVKL